MSANLLKLTSIALAIVAAMVAPACADLLGSIQDGADRVVALQYTDGQWGYPLTAPPTYRNLTGPIGQGLINAFSLTADADHINSAKAAGDALVGVTSDWVGTYNPEFLVALSDATLLSDPPSSASYLAQATSFYADLTAGTYTRAGTDYDTAGWISLLQSARSGSLINYRPWEFSPQAIAADRVGTPAQVAAFVQATKDGIDTLDANEQLDLLGLAGGIRGLAALGVDHDPLTGSYAAAGNLSDLADMLVGEQNPNGSWYWQSTLVTPTASDEDLQTTAYAMLALADVNTSGQYSDKIVLARNYLLSMQMGNGGWPAYPTGDENAEVNGEIVWALSATASIPEPGSIALLGMATAGLGLSRRRRRRRG